MVGPNGVATWFPLTHQIRKRRVWWDSNRKFITTFYFLCSFIYIVIFGVFALLPIRFGANPKEKKKHKILHIHCSLMVAVARKRPHYESPSQATHARGKLSVGRSTAKECWFIWMLVPSRKTMENPRAFGVRSAMNDMRVARWVAWVWGETP